MRYLIPFVALAVLAAIAGCGDDPAGPGESTVSDIVGTYFGSWNTLVAVPATGQEVEVECPGVASISGQDSDGNFSGHWTRAANAKCSAA